MGLKLKLGTASQASSPTTAEPLPTPTAPKPKLKLKSSAPPTPASELPPQAEPLAPPPKVKRPYNKKTSSPKPPKRPADNDISPAPKRSAPDGPARRISFKLGKDGSLANLQTDAGPPSAALTETPTSAGPRLKLQSRRKSSGPKNVSILVKGKPPPRPVGVGYDSEASDAETDPAIEQQFVLRMPAPDQFRGNERVRAMIEGDTAYVRTAVEGRTLGLSAAEGGADVSFKFLTRDLRRAVVTIRGNKYAAALVDLPCLVESMKSWDRKGGWWKVADISQMMLVLGPVGLGGGLGAVDDEARAYKLPKEVDAEFRYAHGLTPPMHWVRKRRFRKRMSYRDIENVDEEVERLLNDDKDCAKRGGKVDWKVYDGDASQIEDGGMEDAEGEYVDSTEDAYGMGMAQTPSQYQEEEDDEDLLAGLGNLDEDDPPADATLNASDMLGATRSSSAGAQGSSAADTPAVAGTPAYESDMPQLQGESSSDEDEDDDDASIDAVDEDAVAERNELQANQEEIADLEKEIANKRQELDRQTNQLLKQRVRMTLKNLEDELEMKKKAFNMEDDDDDE
ncbi:Transcription initiation factor TFIid subunit 7-like protein [Elsinoe fawcettii]|nr:Transcription initiation factor TFIid subunit 7-like protein [Elsinoe fawcettii]